MQFQDLLSLLVIQRRWTCMERTHPFGGVHRFKLFKPSPVECHSSQTKKMSQNGAVQSSPMLSSSSTTISSSAHQQQQVNVSQTLMSANQNRSSLNGWTELFDPNYQRFYYHNPETGETSWYQ